MSDYPRPRIMERSTALVQELGPGWVPLCECCAGCPEAYKGHVSVSTSPDSKPPLVHASLGSTDIMVALPLEAGAKAAVRALAEHIRTLPVEVLATIGEGP